VPFGFRIACRRASWPTRRSPCGVNATTEGVVRAPSAFGITVVWPPCVAAITELVVPRSMPTATAITASCFGPSCSKAWPRVLPASWAESGSTRDAGGQPVISILRGLAASDFGTVTVRTPSESRAVTASATPVLLQQADQEPARIPAVAEQTIWHDLRPVQTGLVQR